MRSYQCSFTAKTDRDLTGKGGVVERLPVCGVHARNHRPGFSYFQDTGLYASAVQEYIR